MPPAEFFAYSGKTVILMAAIAGGYWAFVKWFKRDEHFPRIDFNVNIEVLGQKKAHIVLNIIATLENRGVVPLKIKNFVCKLRGIDRAESLELGGDEIRDQLNFKTKLGERSYLPIQGPYAFVYPGVKTAFPYVTIIPKTIEFVLALSKFEYLANGETHHSGHVMKIPRRI